MQWVSLNRVLTSLVEGCNQMASNFIGNLISNKTEAFQKGDKDNEHVNESFDELLNRILDELEGEK